MRLHRPIHFQLSGGAVAIGIWLSIFSIPIDDETGRPPASWTAGLLVFTVIVVGFRIQLEALAAALLG